MIADELFSNPEEEWEEEELDEEPGGSSASYACEECDYRWDMIRESSVDYDEIELDVVCPMCGSTHVTQI